MVSCPQCGRENADNSKFCVHCGTSLATVAPPGVPPEQPAYARPQYQEPYREPRQPFMGNLQDHPPFILAFVLALVCAIGLTFQITLYPAMGSPLGAFQNPVVILMFGLVLFVGGIAGLAGCVGLWRFREWGRLLVVGSQAAFALAGVLTMIAGGTSQNDGAGKASIIIWGVVMLAIAAFVMFYMFTDEVRSRMQH